MLSLLTGNRSREEWIAEYLEGHQHPANRACHAVGVPLIVASIPLFLVAWFVGGFWRVPLAMFVVGWGFQFLGHAIEGKPPEFMRDPRFLFAGPVWLAMKRRGRQ